jgi:hypothetical protein
MATRLPLPKLTQQAQRVSQPLKGLFYACRFIDNFI